MTIRHAFVAVIGSTLLLAAASAAAQDIIGGRNLAERWCSPCHATSSRGSDATRSFEAIADSPAGEPARMRRFLVDPHPPMPPMQLTQAQIEDLVAYVASLRSR